jgi:two-component system KDP operon response regulator KdpE
MTGHPRCLIIEDEPEIGHLLRVSLTLRQWQVETVTDGSQGLVRAANWRPDLVILDLTLPALDGLDVLARLRAWSQVPVIILTARTWESTKVQALDLGADDYLTKPFSVAELMARIRSVMRRLHRDPHARETAFTTAEWRVDLEQRRVWVRGSEVHLTPIEYRLLCVLIRERGKVMTHQQLLTAVWGPHHARANHYVRIYMAQLRKKIEADPGAPHYFLTESGVGYRLAEPEPELDSGPGPDGAAGPGQPADSPPSASRT